MLVNILHLLYIKFSHDKFLTGLNKKILTQDAIG